MSPEQAARAFAGRFTMRGSMGGRAQIGTALGLTGVQVAGFSRSDDDAAEQTARQFNLHAIRFQLADGSSFYTWVRDSSTVGKALRQQGKEPALLSLANSSFKGPLYQGEAQCFGAECSVINPRWRR